MNTALRFSGVVKQYGRFRALDGLDLAVPRGAVFGLVGSNGAGKTTALAAAAGLLEIHGGRIDVLGDGPFDPGSRAGQVSLLPQDALFPGHARVRELLTFYGALQGLPPERLPFMVDRVLGWVNLTDRATAKTRTLSHGMRRRLAIAQAFLGEPKLVLLDEPLNGLDPREVVNIRALIRRRRGAATIAISSHLLTEIEAVCDHVVIIEEGRAVRQGRLEEFVGRRGRVDYVLRQGELPMNALKAGLPEVSFAWDEKHGVLNAQFSASAHRPEDVNAAVLRMLLEAGVEILEVRRGSNLEQAYLNGSDEL